MGAAGPVLLVALCAMLQLPAGDPARIVARSHHPRPPGPEMDRLEHGRSLSSLCCGEDQRLDEKAAVCLPRRPHRSSRVAGPAHHLPQRSGLTDLPPNCPPPQQYDPEAKVCRDVWRKR